MPGRGRTRRRPSAPSCTSPGRARRPAASAPATFRPDRLRGTHLQHRYRHLAGQPASPAVRPAGARPVRPPDRRRPDASAGQESSRQPRRPRPRPASSRPLVRLVVGAGQQQQDRGVAFLEELAEFRPRGRIEHLPDLPHPGGRRTTPRPTARRRNAPARLPRFPSDASTTPGARRALLLDASTSSKLKFARRPFPAEIGQHGVDLLVLAPLGPGWK